MDSKSNEAINKIWIDYYHKLTGKDGKPTYGDSGCLFHWIAEHQPNYQIEILYLCYEAGFKAGAEVKEDSIPVSEDELSTLCGWIGSFSELCEFVNLAYDSINVDKGYEYRYRNALLPAVLDTVTEEAKRIYDYAVCLS